MRTHSSDRLAYMPVFETAFWSFGLRTHNKLEHVSTPQNFDEFVWKIGDEFVYKVVDEFIRTKFDVRILHTNGVVLRFYVGRRQFELSTTNETGQPAELWSWSLANSRRPAIKREVFVTSKELGNYFSLPLSNPSLGGHLYVSNELNSFLDDGSVCLLVATAVGRGGVERGRPTEIHFSNSLEAMNNTKDRSLVFFKLSPDVITPDNIDGNILVSSMIDSPVTALYHSLQKLYAPVLLSDGNVTVTLDPTLQDLVAKLEIGLGRFIRKRTNADYASNGDLNVIFTPSDELQYWQDVASSGSGSDDHGFVVALRQLSDAFDRLKCCTQFRGCDDHLEQAANALDDLWRVEGSYLQSRMHHLLNICGTQLIQFARTRLSSLQLWTGAYRVVEENLTEAIDLTKRWIHDCHKLTSTFWPKNVSHPWTGKAFGARNVVDFTRRLKEILTVRRMHHQLMRILSEDSPRAAAGGDDPFRPFTGLNALLCNPYTQPLWKAAVAEFESKLKSAEQVTGAKLKSLLQNVTSNPLQLLQDFKRYQILIRRPQIAKILTAERASLLSRLADYVKSKRREFTAVLGGEGRRSGPTFTSSELVATLFWARQLEAKIKDVADSAAEFLKDLPEYEGLAGQSREFIEEIREYQHEQFASWSREVQAAIADGTLGLAASDTVVTFGKDRHMVVTYNPRLVTLTSEVRQLSILGHIVPTTVKKAVDVAKQFSKQAKSLQQIANFHNTIGDQMIASQRPLMLEAAVQLENLVRERKGIAWSDVDVLNGYIRQLQDSVERLSRENRKLRALHVTVCERVTVLMDTDLLHQQQKWKDVLVDIRQLMSRVEQMGYSPDAMWAWKAHWDRQLYKALEHRYRLGMVALHEYLPEIRVELTYRQQRLQFRPPIEEIRAKYYGQLKRFLGIPLVFKGVNEVLVDNLIFPIIVDRNSHLFVTLYRHAEIIFERLMSLQNKFEDWVVLGSVNVNELVESSVQSPDDWDRNFRLTKAKSQEAGRLPNGERVDCVAVSFAPVKAVIDDHIQALWDALKASLRNSIVSDGRAVEEFLRAAIESLGTRPQSVEEIGWANAKRIGFNDRRIEFKRKYEQVEAKNKLLALWVKERVELVSDLRMLWDTFDRHLEIHEQMIEKQVDELKLNMLAEIEKFNADVDKFVIRWHQFKPKDEQLSDNHHQIVESIAFIREKKQEFALLMDAQAKIESNCNQFGMGQPEFEASERLRRDIEHQEAVWFVFEEFHDGLRQFAEEDWIVFRGKTYVFEEYLNQWSERLIKPGTSASDATVITVRLLREIDVGNALLSLLKFCRGDVFSQEHWAELFGLIGISSHTPVEKLTFGDIFDARDAIIANGPALKELNARAQGEIAIRQALNELDIWAVSATFALTEYKDSNGQVVTIIKDWKDLINKVGDHQSLMQSLKDSPYYKGFSDRASIWEKRLADLDEYLHHLNNVQRKWVYLEPIFGRGALASESARFERINDDFRSILKEIHGSGGRLVLLCNMSNLRNTLNTLTDQLQRCQKSLNEFLEMKRSAFPRFYFIGDDDLLEILGQSTNPAVISAHLKKLFAGIRSVTFDDDARHIVAMRSLEGETVALKAKVRITAHVEEWLEHLSSEMKSTLGALLVECLRATAKEPKDDGGGVDWTRYPQQVSCLAEEIRFTEHCEDAIRHGSLVRLEGSLKARLRRYTTALQPKDDSLDDLVTRLKLEALILTTIHMLSIVDELKKNGGGVRSLDDWTWQKQLRFYVQNDSGKDDGRVVAKMVDAQFDYTYEYQGNAAKLVHTPLTDRCYLTLTQAMKMGLGGNPYGPAGTGKTESVKALGALLGRQVLVFNCDEGLDVKSMGRIFVGLVKCGCFGCFDEFNRLDEAVLSAVSMQIQAIQAALKEQAKSVVLLDSRVDVDPNSGIFVTMNPLGKGYGGRQKLPDNLKQLFCPIVMCAPDNELIAEVLLFAEGFTAARDIGCKLVAIFGAARESLSSQQHYDWGLRALKTVLRSCGSLLRMSRNLKQELEEIEYQLAVQALRMNTVSKLTSADCCRFNGLVRDVFVGVAFRDFGYEAISKAVVDSCVALGLSVIGAQVQKIVELYEQLQQRIGVVVVGPSGSGKSTLWRVLLHALNKQLDHRVLHYALNPKAVTRTQLLGHIDADTREWSDGVLTSCARRVIREPQHVHSWIVCDGDIDPEWIESLNSVLDDNHLLTMPSGERIQFGPNVNFLFETHNLRCASPATVSRMGVIFLGNEDAHLKAIVASWLERHNKKDLRVFIDDYFYQAIEWIRSHNNLVLDASLVGIVTNVLFHLKSVACKSQFAVALVRGLGSCLEESSRDAFAKQVFQWTQEMIPDPQNPLNCYYDSAKDRLSAYTDESGDGITLEALSNGDGLPLVVTANMRAQMDCVLSLLQSEDAEPFLLVGPEGCGKSLLLQHCFRRLQRSVQVAVVHCSATTTSQHVLQKLSQVCVVFSSNVGRIYKPKDCETLVLYLRDLNLPKPDEWGTCQLVTFLQQLVTYRGFYDSNLDWVGLDGVQIVASLAIGNASGRHTLSSRFASIVRICSLSYPSKEQMQFVCRVYLQPILMMKFPKHPTWSSSSKIHHLAGSMVQVFEQVRKQFSTNDRSHYVFTPRDLLGWALGLLHYDLDVLTSDPSSRPFLDIWAYEAQRIMKDRLVGKDAKGKFEDIIGNVFSHDWGLDLSFAHGLLYSACGCRAEVSVPPGAPVPVFGRPLGKIDSDSLKTVVEKSVTLYNREHRQLDLIVFPEVIDQFAQVDRVLSVPGGSLLLCGPSGVSRRSLVSIVANMHGHQIMSPKIAKRYSAKQFCADLKVAIQAAGIDGQEVTFILEDHHIVEYSFLELVSGLISAGEIPGLYAAEELEPLLVPLQNQMAQENYRDSHLNYFTSRVRKNLHIALILDATNPNLPVYCESNPALYKLCCVNWIEGWGRDSLIELPKIMLSKNSNKGANEDSSAMSIDDALAENFYKIHSSCLARVATPRRYLSFIRTYRSIYVEKKDVLEQRRVRLEAGISKLNEAKSAVAKLKAEAAEQSKLLVEKQGEADKALHLITNNMTSASDQKIEMEALREETRKENEKLFKRKKAIDVELAEVEPLVQEAMTAVGNIKTESLSEIRSLRAPPDVIRDILEAVLRLMGTFDTSWNSMKSFLAKRGVKDEIMSFDARNVSTEIRESVEELLANRKDSFDPKNAKRASVAAAPLAAWVKANVQYAKILQKIKPLEQEQNKLQKNLMRAEDRMGRLSSDLDNVDKYVAELRDRLNKFTKEAAQIEINLKVAQDTIRASESLVSKLDDEDRRWNEQIGETLGQLECLPLQALLAAAYVAYLAMATEGRRRELFAEWIRMLDPNGRHQMTDLRGFLSSEREQLLWRSQGLPSDELSTDNAIIILQTSLRPFLIDPAGRATEWLKTHLSDRRLEVISYQDDNFSSALELAVRFGKTLIIEDVDDIEPVLVPLLRYDLISMGPRFVVQIGDKVIDYNEDFRLFLTTRNSAADIPPQSSSLISIVNFTTTRAGLQGQLLAVALQNEKPALEIRRSELLRQEEDLKTQLIQFEDYLLEQLANAKGNILQNEDLLSSLNKAKENSFTIAKSLTESMRLQESLNKERDVYLPFADYGSQLYFAIADLLQLNNMYSFSLVEFFRLFNRVLTHSEKSEAGDASVRTAKLVTMLKGLVYEYIARSLFKADHLMFALHIVHSMYPAMFGENEWDAFTGMLVVDFKTDLAEVRRSLPSWVNEERALSVALLRNVFPHVYAVLRLEDQQTWHGFATSLHCERDIPASVVQKLTPFQQVLVVQSLKPDRLESAMTLFASRALGFSNLSPPALNLRQIWHETSPQEPVLVITSAGADPSQELQEIAHKAVGPQHYHQVAMGQGQSEVAVRLLRECSQNGDWLCLNNLHLVTSWLSSLEKELNSLSTPHEKFHLWLTTESHPRFSNGLLQRSRKVVYEAPPGIRRNLQRTYDSWSPDFVSKSGSVVRSQTLFMLAWFHAVLQERRSFIPQGWTKFYEFSYADLKAGADIIDRFCQAGGRSSPQWEVICGLFQSTIYGGRLDNAFDTRVLVSYLRQFFNDNLASSGNRLTSFGLDVTIPKSCNHAEYLAIVEKLSDEDQPSYFGLPANIEQSKQRTFSNQVVSRLRVLMRSNEVVRRFDRDTWQSELSPILNLWKKLNQNSKLVRVVLGPHIDVVDGDDNDGSAIVAVTRVEFFNAVKLVQFVHSTLAALSKVLRGTTLLAGDIAGLASALLRQESPQMWLDRWQGPDEPMQYLRTLMAKALAIERWLKKAETDSLLAEPCNLAELFHPDRFLNALRQQTARLLRVSLDSLKLVTAWRSQQSSSAAFKMSLRLSGLQIEGCLFNGSRLTESQHDSASITSLPDVTVAFVQDNVGGADDDEVLSLPLYITYARTDLVACLDVPCGRNRDTWVLCGAAIFLQPI